MLERNLLLTIGFLALMSGAVLAGVWLHQRPVMLPPSGAPEAVSILTAAHPIAAGALLRPADIAATDVSPGEKTPDEIADAAASDAAYDGALARRDFAAGEPLSAAGLLKSSDRTFLSAVLGPGMRAVTLPVEAPQTASGLVLPGDHVDVILTQDAAGAPGQQSARGEVAETVLSDVRVVAVDSALTPQPKPLVAGPGAVDDLHAPSTLTLEVSEGDAQRLLVAARLGKLDLAVRALVASREAAAPPAPTWATDVSPAAEVQPKPATAPAAAAHQTIEVMHGGKIELR